MKARRTLTLAAAMVLTLGLAIPAGAADEASSGLDRIKALEGTWKGTNSKDQEVTVTFGLVAGGSVVQEHLVFAGHDMVTMYYLDGDRLMLTHYCMVGNQPTMVAKEVGSEEIRWEFVEATNLKSPEAGHMHSAVMRFPGSDEFQAAWTFRQDGKDAFTETIKVARVR